MSLGPRDTTSLVMLSGWDATELRKYELQDGTSFASVVASLMGALTAISGELYNDPIWSALVSYTDINEGFCPFKDVRVRKAITLGINRQAIVDALLSGKTTVPVSQWPNSGWTNNDLTVDAYDPDAAAALLDEAGYTLGADGIRVGDCNGEQVRLSFNFETTTAPIRIDIATAAQADLAKLGIEFTPIHTVAGTFFGQYVDGGPLTTGKYDMGGYTTGFYPDHYTNSYKCEEIPTAENPSGNNWYHLCDPALSDLIESSLATVDPAERKAILDEAQAYIAENYYVIMMYARANVFGSTPRFQFGATGGDSHMFWQAETWDITE